MAMSMALPVQDIVYLKDVHMRASVGPEAWHRLGRQQPVVISVKMPTNINAAGDLDDVTKTIHYGILSKSVIKTISSQVSFQSLRHLADAVAEATLIKGNGGDIMELTALLPEALILGQGFGIETRHVKTAPQEEKAPVLRVDHQVLFVKDLKLSCIIGVNPHERLEKQPVVINLKFWEVDEIFYTQYADSIRKVSETVETSTFETIEALATLIAKVLCGECPVHTVTVAVEKPRALTFVDAAGVEITRNRKFFNP